MDGYLLTLIPRSITDAEQGGGEVPACFTLSIPLHEDVGDVVAGALQVIGLNNLGQKRINKHLGIFYNTSQSKSSMSVLIMYVELWDSVTDIKSVTVRESTTWPIT